MHALKLSAVGGVIVAVAIGTLWLQREDTASSRARPTQGVDSPRQAHAPEPRATASTAADVADARSEIVPLPGLSRSDSERVVVKGFHDASACWFDALRVEAKEQSVSFDALLDATEAMLDQSDGPVMAALIDVDAVRAREIPCVLNVVQQVGIPASVLGQASR